MKDELPEGWTPATLGEISSRVTKGSTPTSYGHEYQTSGIRFVKVESIRNGIIDHGSIRNYISVAAHESQPRSIFQDGDILFSIAGTIGVTALVSKKDLPANTNQALAIIRGTQESLLRSFLTAQLRSVVQTQAREQERGGGMNNISLEDVKVFTIAVAPVNEQRRIVAQLETLLARVRSSEDRLYRIPTILKRFRQSVFAAACTGRLTADWRIEHLNVSSGTVIVAQLSRAHDEAGGQKCGNAAPPTEDLHDWNKDDLSTGWELTEMRSVVDPRRPITYGILKPGPESEKLFLAFGYGDLGDGLHEHFDRLIGIQETQMSKRLSHGYNSFLGLPQARNPAHAAHHYVSSESQSRDRLYGFDEKPEVSGWFTARENLLHKYMRKLEKRELVLKHLT